MLSFTDFNNLSNEEKLTYLQKLRNQRSVNDIASAWGISKSKYYAMAREIGLPMKARGKRARKTNSSPSTETQNANNTPNQITTEPEEQNNRSKFSFSLDTQGPASMVYNVLSIFKDTGFSDDTEVRFKIEITEV
ncbi:hypothetical protein [Syntrophomonas erecta]